MGLASANVGAAASGTQRLLKNSSGYRGGMPPRRSRGERLRPVGDRRRCRNLHELFDLGRIAAIEACRPPVLEKRSQRSCLLLAGICRVTLSPHLQSYSFTPSTSTRSCCGPRKVGLGL